MMIKTYFMSIKEIIALTHLSKQSNWVQPPAAPPANLPTTKGGSTKLNLRLINFFSKEVIVKFSDGKERQSCNQSILLIKQDGMLLFCGHER